MKPPITLLFKICDTARATANDLKENAAFNGAMDDGGAGTLHSLANVYEAGLRQEVPTELAHYYKQAEKESDPEYETYLRLKNKFKER